MKDLGRVKKILTVAGSDSGGGAGIQADIKTVSALGHYAMSAITAVTAQNTLGVTASEPVSPNMLSMQLDAVYTDIFPDAVKTGMLYSAENVNILADKLEEYGAVNVVCDTVIMSTSGKTLLDDEGVNAFINRLMPLADVLTPNIPEAEKICGMRITDRSDMEKAAEVMSGLTKGAVLIKGGHLPFCADDLLYCNGVFRYFCGEKISNPNTHGTGCTLSSAIAVFLAEGCAVPEAVKRAKEYITAAISAGFDIGKGSGPLWHFV
ncbi:MAG: bifunctional hydroxymethylpyrimidine kinase/phosphomethylpyrimidine kinase [Huintestinicola sp.]